MKFRKKINLKDQINCFIIKYKNLLIFSFLLYFIVGFIDEIFARAGGGHGYSSGGSRGSSGGSGGGDGEALFAIVRLLIHLTIRYPLIGIPLDIAFIVIVYKLYGQGKSHHVTKTIQKGNRVYQQKRIENLSFDEIKSNDPEFLASDFIERSKKVFSSVQKDWDQQNMDPSRRYISDGIYERFNSYLDIQKSSMIRNRVENVTIKNAQIVSVESDKIFDTIHVLFHVECVDYTERTDKNKIVQGSKTPTQFREYWSFLRKKGAQTKVRSGLLDGFCPNCGNPLQLTDKTKCPSCSAIINSGEYDWVLSEITQVERWNSRTKKDVKGIDQVISQDPHFNVQHLEDKASVAFWKLRQAEFFADSKFLLKYASNDFILNRNFQEDEKGLRSFYQDPAIGHVDLLSLVSDEESKTIKAEVWISWSAHQEKKKVPSFIIPEYHLSIPREQIFVFEKKMGSKTDQKQLLSSTHCPGCGAPETDNTTSKCEYCGLVLNDGSRDWVLTEVRSYNQYSYSNHVIKKQVIKETLSTPQMDERLLIILIKMMLADGTIDQKEQKLLDEVADKNGFSNQKIQNLLQAVSQNKVQAELPENFQEAKVIIEHMIQMALIDGKVCKSEKKMIKSIVKKLGYSDYDIDMIISRERAKRYRQSKQILKKSKKY